MSELIILIQLLLVHTNFLSRDAYDLERGTWGPMTQTGWSAAVDRLITDQPYGVTRAFAERQPSRLDPSFEAKLIAHAASLGVAVDIDKLREQLTDLANGGTLDDTVFVAFEQPNEPEAPAEENAADPFAGQPGDTAQQPAADENNGDTEEENEDDNSSDPLFKDYPLSAADWTDEQTAAFDAWFDETFDPENTEQLTFVSGSAASERFVALRDKFHKDAEAAKVNEKTNASTDADPLARQPNESNKAWKKRVAAAQAKTAE